MQTNSIERYFLFILLIITIIFTLIILYPFLTVFILAAAFAVVLNPIYLWIKTHLVKNISWLASFLTILLFLLCLCVPLFFVGKAVFSQTHNIYVNIINSNNSNDFIEKIDTSINRLLPAGFNFDTHTKIAEFVSSLTNNLANFFSSTIQTLISLILMVFTLFYLLKDGENWKKGLMKLIPLSDKNTSNILSSLIISINQIFKGSFIIAIAQGLLAWAGFIIFGIPNPIIWAIVAGIASFVPAIGTAVVTVPAVLFLFITGMEIQALGLFIWSIVIVGTIDNILRPYIISRDTEIPSLFILFAILGGISLIGALGILIGPLVISLLYSLISIYKEEINNHTDIPAT